MFGKKMVADMISRSAETESDRRKFLKAAGLAGLGTVGAASMIGAGTQTASAATISDPAILNFALNLEYLEAEFYLHAVRGYGLDSSMTDGKGARGGVTGGSQVPFSSSFVKAYATEIAGDELAHVTFLRSALGTAKVARPKIDLQSSFTNAAIAAGVIKAGQTFNPFADDNSFLLGAFLFEDVGVTAYKGAAPLIQNKTYLEAAAGILSVEAYHAGIIRTALLSKGLYDTVQKLSNARDGLDNWQNDDMGIKEYGKVDLVPTDSNGITYSRTPGDVLNIVYLNKGEVTKGGFFPNGVNGELNTSSAYK